MNSIEELNANLAWKLAGSVTGVTAIQLPNEFKELAINVQSDGGSYDYYLIKEFLTNDIQCFYNGGGINASGTSVTYLRLCRIDVSLSSVILSSCQKSESNVATNYLNNAITTVYYR